MIVGGISLWSIMTAFCGVASNYWTLFVGRVGVGIGETVLSPASYSLIGDCFPRKRLGVAIGAYSLGSVAGGGASLIVGSFVIERLERLGPVALPLLGLVQPWQLT